MTKEKEKTQRNSDNIKAKRKTKLFYYPKII